MAKRAASKSTSSAAANGHAGGGKVNKAELIRKVARSMGKTVRPKDIIRVLKEQGVVVTSPQVSKTLKAAGFHRKRRGGKTGGKAHGASGSGKVNKAQRIREVAKSMGKKVRPRDVIAALLKEGIEVASAQVSTTLRAAGYRRKRRRGRIAHAVGMKPGRRSGGHGFNLEALVAAKALAHQLGGIDAAQEALSLLKKLQ